MGVSGSVVRCSEVWRVGLRRTTEMICENYIELYKVRLSWLFSSLFAYQRSKPK